MEIDIFHKLYGKNGSANNGKDIYSKEPFDYINGLTRPPLHDPEFYVSPEPLSRLTPYSNFNTPASQLTPKLSLPMENNFKSNSFWLPKARFDPPETKSLPVFSSNLFNRDELYPINYKKQGPLIPGPKDRKEFPLKLPEFEQKQLNESVLIEPEPPETFKQPPDESKIIEQNKNKPKRESSMVVIVMEQHTSNLAPGSKISKENIGKKAQQIKEDKENSLEKQNSKSEDKSDKNKEDKEKKTEKKDEEEKKDNEKKMKKKNDKKIKEEKTRNVIVVIPCLCVCVLLFSGLCVGLPLAITLNNQNNLISTIANSNTILAETTFTTNAIETKFQVTTTVTTTINEVNKNNGASSS